MRLPCSKAPRNFKQISHNQRHTIQTLYRKGMKVKKIAHMLNIHRSSVYRELKRGWVENLRSDLSIYETYSADRAIIQSKENASNKGAKLKISNHQLLNQNLSTLMLEGGASAYAALEVCKQNFTSQQDKAHIPCVKTIYNYIHRHGFPIMPEQMIHKKHKKKDKNTYRRDCYKRSADMSIENRDSQINKRKEIGHHEMDLVVGAQGTKGCLLVITERVTRFEHIVKLPDKTQKSVRKALNKIETHYGKEKFKELFKTITCDNGSEFLDAELMTKSRWGKDARFKLYYAHPYCSSERGSNENANRLIRRFIPKGTSMKKIKQEKVNEIARWMNNYPRKLFSGKSSASLAKQFTFHNIAS